MKVLVIVASIFAHDGDTLINGDQRIRLWGIDAPELSQTCDGGTTLCGKQARDALQELIDSGQLKCIEKDVDYWKRSIALCHRGSIDLSKDMVRQGWALAYRQYSDDYIDDEAFAKLSKVGIWLGTFIEPWKWRKGKR